MKFLLMKVHERIKIYNFKNKKISNIIKLKLTGDHYNLS